MMPATPDLFLLCLVTFLSLICVGMLTYRQRFKRRKLQQQGVDWLNTLYEHGPDVLSNEEFDRVSRRYCRHYFRRALRWKKEYGPEAVERHFEALEHQRGPTNLLTYADAWIDWALIRLGVRKYWSGWPS